MKENENKTITTLNIDSGIELIKPDEEFRQLPMGKRYYISNYGRLLRIKKNGEIKLVKPSQDSNGYLHYTIGRPTGNPNEYIKRCYQAHDLVGIMFVPCQYTDQDTDSVQIHHKDHDVQNNDARNLMWTSTPDHGLIHTIRGVGIFDWGQMDILWFNGQEDWLAYELGVSVPELMRQLRDARDTNPEGVAFKVGDQEVFIAFKPRRKRKQKQDQIIDTDKGGDAE